MIETYSPQPEKEQPYEVGSEGLQWTRTKAAISLEVVRGTGVLEIADQAVHRLTLGVKRVLPAQVDFRIIEGDNLTVNIKTLQN